MYNYYINMKPFIVFQRNDKMVAKATSAKIALRIQDLDFAST